MADVEQISNGSSLVGGVVSSGAQLTSLLPQAQAISAGNMKRLSSFSFSTLADAIHQMR